MDGARKGRASGRSVTKGKLTNREGEPKDESRTTDDKKSWIWIKAWGGLKTGRRLGREGIEQAVLDKAQQRRTSAESDEKKAWRNAGAANSFL